MLTDRWKGSTSAALAACLLMSGCALQGPRRAATTAFYAGDYRTAIAMYTPFENNYNRDFALNSAELGSVYMACGAYGLALNPLRSAGKVMERTKTSWGNAFMSTIAREDAKEYKGDPFERVMCHYYRGLIHYRNQDYNAALAAFRRALDADKDTMSKDAADTKGLPVIHYLAGRCYELLGEPDSAETHYNRFTTMTGAKITPGNALFVVEWGDGPLKKRTGLSDCMLEIQPRDSGIRSAKIFLDGKEIATVTPQVSLAAHAATHTQTSASTIQITKSVVKQAVRVLAFAGTLTAVLLATHGQEVGAGIAAGAGAAIVAGALVRAERDVRIWDMLPDSLSVGALMIPAGHHHIALCYYDQSGTELPEWRQTFYHYPVSSQDTLIYARPAYCRFGSFAISGNATDAALLLQEGKFRVVHDAANNSDILYPNPPALWQQNQVENLTIL